MANKIKPVYIMNTRRVDGIEREAAKDAITEVLGIAGVEHLIDVHDFGSQIINNGPYSSPEWYISKAPYDNYYGYGAQKDASKLLQLLEIEPWKRDTPHYDVFIVEHDLGARGLNFVVGVGGYSSLVISPRRLRNLNKDEARYLVFKTGVMHELGHVFDAAAGRQGVDAETGTTGSESGSVYLYRNHCSSDGCVMRQGNTVPSAWIKMTNDILENKWTFCGSCESDMRTFFQE